MRSSGVSTQWRNYPVKRFCEPTSESAIGGVHDLERLLAKVTLNTASPRDLLSLGKSLDQLRAVAKAAGQLQHPDLRAEIDLLEDVRDRILSVHFG